MWKTLTALEYLRWIPSNHISHLLAHNYINFKVYSKTNYHDKIIILWNVSPKYCPTDTSNVRSSHNRNVMDSDKRNTIHIAITIIADFLFLFWKTLLSVHFNLLLITVILQDIYIAQVTIIIIELAYTTMTTQEDISIYFIKVLSNLKQHISSSPVCRYISFSRTRGRYTTEHEEGIRQNTRKVYDDRTNEHDNDAGERKSVS